MATGKNIQLTREIVPRANMRQVGLTILITIVGLIIVNLACIWYLAHFSPNTGYLLVAAKWKLLETLERPVDLLILGDSSGNQGVDPEVIGERLRLSSLNLCTIGGNVALDDAWMLDDYIKRHGSPRAALIVHGYDVWSRVSMISVLAKTPGSWWNRKPDLNLSARDRLRVFLNRYVPIYAETQSLGYVFQHPYLAFRSNLELRPDGFMPEKMADPKQVIKDMGAHIEYIRSTDIYLSEENRKALDYIARLADKGGFDVYIADGPLYDRLYDDSTFREFYAGVRSEINRLTSAHERLHYIMNPPMLFDKYQMQSADHVIYAAARNYTGRLADAIDSLEASKSPSF